MAKNRIAPLENRKSAIDKIMATAAHVPERGQEYRIEGNNGLVLYVWPSGAASWFFRYVDTRVTPPKQRRKKIGRLEFIPLDMAVAEAAAMRKRVADGENLDAQVEAFKSSMTLRQLFESRVAMDDARAPSTMENYRLSLERDVFPTLADRPAGAITSDEIEAVLEVIERRSRHAAHRSRSALGSTYRWALKRKKTTGVRSNPTVGMGFTIKSKPRTNVLTPVQLRTLWLGMDRPDARISDAVKRIIRLCILTGQRRSEVTCALLEELNLTDNGPIWKIPAVRMKRKDRDQVVPLSRQAAEIFRYAIGTRNGGFVFPVDMSRVAKFTKPRYQHLDPHSASTAMRRLVALIDNDAEEDQAAVKLGDTHVHDMRKVLTTWLREQRFRSDVIDAILHHAPRGVTGSHYDFATLEEPVREALQAWADHVTKTIAD